MNTKRIKLLYILVTSFVLSQPKDLSQDWITNNNFPFKYDLEELVYTDISILTNILGFIVIKDGVIIFENYYNGSDQDDIYNIWSVTKSYISTLIGQSIDMGFLEDPSRNASNFFPDYGINYTDSFTLHNLLSMSSGYQDGYGYPYWYLQDTETLLSMGYSSPGSFLYNNSACHLNSHVIYYGADKTPLEFANTYLFPYLGIENPEWNSGYLDINDGSASLHLNLRDMVKLGQLYLQDGYSDTNQIISSDWIDQATLSHVSTGSNGWDDLPNYGYLWWLPEMEGSYLAFGFGGQYIAVIPQYNLVIGSHSTDWGPGSISSHQIELRNKIFDIIVPFLSKSTVVINEILSFNSSCCTDEYGEYDSYIELYNYGSDTLDVGGYRIDNDSPLNDNFSQIPVGNDSTKIPPGEFLMLWLDGDFNQGVLHVDNLLDNSGGDIGLYADSINSIDIVNYPITASDLAYARLENGPDWIYMDPTPNMNNIIELKVENSVPQPRSFELFENYPNPFNPVTKIKYNLVNENMVSLTIFDVTGKNIKNLFKSIQASGSYEIEWDATNNFGQSVPAGMYIYSLEIGKEIQSKKMILLK